MELIEFVDGNTNTVISRTPFDEVPPPNREVYLRDGVRVDEPQQGDEVVPIARVVKLAVDDTDTPVPDHQATRVYMREYDEQGVLRRETVMVRGGTSGPAG